MEERKRKERVKGHGLARDYGSRVWGEKRKGEIVVIALINATFHTLQKWEKR